MKAIGCGRVIADRYRLERAIARGGMGSVWIARHLQLDRLLAIKFIDGSLAASPEARSRFEREARAAALLHGPNVVEIHDYGVEGNVPYLVMELLQGEDLSARLQRVGRLAPQEAAPIVWQVAKALRRAHDASIVHRDLKPGNIFIVRDVDEEVVKLLDFGVAKAPSLGIGDDVTKSGTLVGSPRYMSPEQARGTRELDHRTDLWALGVIAFRMLTGQLPFPGKEIGDVILKICTEPVPVPSSIVPELGPDVDAFFERAFERDPDMRFQSARELAKAFVAAMGEQAPTSISSGSMPRIERVSSTPSLDGSPVLKPRLPFGESPHDGAASGPKPRLPFGEPISAARITPLPIVPIGEPIASSRVSDCPTQPSASCTEAAPTPATASAAPPEITPAEEKSSREPAPSRLSWTGTLPSDAGHGRGARAWASRSRKVWGTLVVAMTAAVVWSLIALRSGAPEHAIAGPPHVSAHAAPMGAASVQTSPPPDTRPTAPDAPTTTAAVTTASSAKAFDRPPPQPIVRPPSSSFPTPPGRRRPILGI